MISPARHIEVQILGDGETVTHLFERDCSIQRRYQKLIEIAPSPWLQGDLRKEIIDSAALRLGDASHFQGVRTVEFLVEMDQKADFTGRFFH